MILASHYIFKDMLNALKNPEAAEEVFDKFRKRYPEDMELVEVCKGFKKYMKSKESVQLERIKKILKTLEETRGMESGGGTELWYEDRRSSRD